MLNIRPGQTVINLKTKQGFYKELRFQKLLSPCPLKCPVPQSFRELYKHDHNCSYCNNTGVYLEENKYLFRLIYESYPMIFDAMERARKENEADAWEILGERRMMGMY